jgi:hypothetical protein
MRELSSMQKYYDGQIIAFENLQRMYIEEKILNPGESALLKSVVFFHLGQIRASEFAMCIPEEEQFKTISESELDRIANENRTGITG